MAHSGGWRRLRAALCAACLAFAVAGRQGPLRSAPASRPQVRGIVQEPLECRSGVRQDGAQGLGEFVGDAGHARVDRVLPRPRQAWADYLDQLLLGNLVATPESAAPAVAASIPAGAAVPSPSRKPTFASAPNAKEQVAVLPSLSNLPQDLSTLETSRFLNASHLFVGQEIEGGRLRSREVGSDLRIAMSDLVPHAMQFLLGISVSAQS